MEQKNIFVEIFKEYCSEGHVSNSFYEDMKQHISSYLENVSIAKNGSVFRNEASTMRMTRLLSEKEVESAYKTLNNRYTVATSALKLMNEQHLPFTVSHEDIDFNLVDIVNELAQESVEKNLVDNYIKKVDLNEIKECLLFKNQNKRSYSFNKYI